MTAFPVIHPRAMVSLVLFAPVLALTGCDELGLRRAAPQEMAADSLADSTVAAAEPAQPKARPRPPRDRSYPSAEEVMYGPPAPRESPTPAASAQSAPRPDPSVPVRSDLERLVRAQEQHWANTGQYAERFQHLGLRYVPHAGVNVVIESATDSGWIGRAVRTGWEGRSCVVWVGRPDGQPTTDGQRLRATRPGVPVCDSL
ncbi:MAG TPA: hypothetical protein VFT04_03575 [Gemmatimonadales bacterium]|nr:hypothetical protein [Gemmatimonadales bacterium]